MNPALLKKYAKVLLVTSGVSLFSSTVQAEPEEVYIIRHRFHTGLAMARDQLDQEQFGPLLEAFPQFRYLEIGWGDREFYMASGDSIWLAIRAMLWPTDTAMHVVGFNSSPEKRFPYSEMVAVPLDKSQFQTLNHYIAQHFESFEPIGKGLYGPSSFYPAKGSFHLFRTCNVWTAESLEAAKLDISATLALTARSVLDQAAPFGRVLRTEDEVEALAH